MRELIKLELEKNNIRTYLLAVLGITVVITAVALIVVLSRRVNTMEV